MMGVDRCVCHQVRFAQLKAMLEQQHALSESTPEEALAALSAITGCSTGCGLCRPYILRMIETGRTSFDPIPFDG